MIFHILLKNYNFYSSAFIMEPEPKLRSFFGSGTSQKGRLRLLLRNSVRYTYLSKYFILRMQSHIISQVIELT